VNPSESPKPVSLSFSLQELIRQAAQDLQPEITTRQIELEFDLPSPPICEFGRIDSIGQAIRLLLADAILRSDPGDVVLVTLVGDARRWEIEIADARETDDDEAAPRVRWISEWPPLQQAMRDFAGAVDIARCPQGGWAVTLSGQLIQTQRAAG
jgi:hypothetical protein